MTLLAAIGALAWYLALVSGKCLLIEDEKIFTEFFYNIDWKPSVVLEGRKIANITVQFSWALRRVPDGTLYKIRSSDKKQTERSTIILPRNETNLCENNLNGYWGRQLSKEDFEVVCGADCFCDLTLCQTVPEYDTLDKDLTHVEIPADFGVNYDLSLLAYVNFTQSQLGQSFPASVFCLDELIGTQNMDRNKLNGICDGSLNGKIYPIGPVANLTLVDITYDIIKTTATAKFVWKEPYDIADNITIAWFCANYEFTPKCDSDGLKVDYVQSPPEKAHYYGVGVNNLEFGSAEVFYAAAYSEDSPGEKVGFEKAIEYKVSDVNACDGTHAPRYCDENAQCEDLSASSKVPAICKCYWGFSGDGVSQYYNGSGCKISCHSRDIANHTCAPTAVCGSENGDIVCSCTRFSFGDGYKLGKGCTSLLVVVGPIVGLAFLLMCLIFYVKRRLRKRRTLAYMSRFIEESTSGVRYISVDHGVFGKWELDRKDIVLYDVIGRGTFGVVHKATLRKGKEESVVAAKVVTEGAAESAFLGEMSLVISIQHHENVLTLIGCCTSSPPTMLVTVYMEYGDLLHFLWDAREAANREKDSIYQLTEKQVYQIGRQVARGMQHLVQLKIIHGDLAARNILVGKNLQCKISDFGLANDVYRYGIIKGAIEKRVPLKWISPERMMHGEVPITWRSDVWSCGILLFEAITLGGAPFPDIVQKDLFFNLKAGYRMSKPISSSDYLYKIMQRCWQWTPSKRPSFKDLLDVLQPEKEDLIYPNLHEIIGDIHKPQQEDLEEIEHSVII